MYTASLPIAVCRAAAMAAEADRRGIAYLHLMRADFAGKQSGDVVTPVRKAFRGTLVLNMGFTVEEAERTVEAGTADAIAFGTAFLANPDLPARIAAHAPLNVPDPSTFYAGGAKGYTDYPAMAPAAHSWGACGALMVAPPTSAPASTSLPTGGPSRR
jgi:2,4-dienoyl-CoA reductase-like NADH-dependent reductase (Old Yellow Enzyme family)